MLVSILSIVEFGVSSRALSVAVCPYGGHCMSLQLWVELTKASSEHLDDWHQREYIS